MSWRRRSSDSTEPGVARRWPRITAVVVMVAIVGLLFFGRGVLALRTRRMAADRMNARAVTAAQQWLAWSAWFDPDNGSTNLMQATCFRYLRQKDQWNKALESAKRKGAPAPQIQLELRLSSIQNGNLLEGVENQVSALIEAGVPPSDVCAAFVQGYLTRKEPEMAKMVLDAWASDHPEESRVADMRGVYWLWLGYNEGNGQRRYAAFDRAETEFKNALAKEPCHELARLALAEFLEDQGRLEEALQQYVELATRSPVNRDAKVGMARLLRQLGWVDEARTVLERLASGPDPSADVVVEMGQVELECGNYEEAQQWFEQVDLDPMEDYVVSSAPPRALAFAGKTARALRLFDEIDAEVNRSARVEDLLFRLAVGHSDTEAFKEANDELRRLSAPSSTPSPDASPSTTEQAGRDWHEVPATSAAESYEQYCAACHGANGDGEGRAARHLFPKPRDLRTGRARLVTTTNGIPTLEDIKAVIEKGMPGTSMQSFEDLDEDRRRLLAEEVLRLNREGIRSQMIDLLRSEGEEIDADEVRQVVDECTTPGEIVLVPRIGPAESRAIARGKDTYFELGCQHCHGDDGVGVEDNPVHDDKGRLTRPRDLVHEPFKGGREPASVYLRIVAGMPGSPHPATLGLTEEELVDLVQYCRSLSQEPKLVLTNLERANRTAGPAYFSALSGASAP